MRAFLLFDADKKVDVGAFATHGLDAGPHHARDFGDPIFEISFGRGKRAAGTEFINAENSLRGGFSQTVEIDVVDARRFGGSEQHQA